MSVERSKTVINLKDADKLFRKFEATLYKMSTNLTDHEVKKCFLHKGENRYYYTLENEDQIPAICPKCHKGHLYIRQYRCINPEDLADEFWLELTACSNKHQCDFVSHENVGVKLGNKLITENIESIEKRKETINEKKEYVKNLEEMIEENSWGSVMKALIRKSPKVIVGSMILLLIVTIFGLNSLFGNVSQKLTAKFFNQEISYEMGE